MYKKASDLVRIVFDNRPDFLLTRDAVRKIIAIFYVDIQSFQACVKFINRNAVTQSLGNATKSPELLARYCDVLLRRGFVGLFIERINENFCLIRNRGLEESALEEKFDEIMVGLKDERMGV